MRKDYLAVGFLVLVVIALCWKAVFLGFAITPTNPHCDVTYTAFPLKLLAAQILKLGQAPLWNPYIMNGYPMHATNDINIFSPVDIIFNLFPNLYTWGLIRMFNIILSGIFMYLYMRKIKISIYGAAISGLVYMLCPGYLAEMQWVMYVGPFVFFALVLLAIEYLLEKKKFLYSVFLALALGCTVLNGVMISSFYIFIAATAYFFYRSFAANYARRDFLRLTLLFACGILLGLAIGAIQAIPTLELVPFSHRSLRAEKWLAESGWSFTRIISVLINTILPNIVGDTTFSGKVFWFFGGVEYACYYIGYTALIFALLALFRRPAVKEVNFARYGFIFIISYLFIISFRQVRLGIYKIFPQFFILTPNRWETFYFPFMAILSGCGADYVFQDKDGKAGRLVYRILVTLLVALVSVFSLINLLLIFGKNQVLQLVRSMISLLVAKGLFHFNHPAAYYFDKKIPFYFNIFADNLKFNSFAVLFPIIALFCSVLLFKFYLNAKNKRGLVIGLIILSLAVELLLMGSRTLCISNPKLLYPRIEELEFIKQRDTGPYRVLPIENIEKINWQDEDFKKQYDLASAYRTQWTIMPFKIEYLKRGILSYHGMAIVAQDSPLALRRFAEVLGAIDNKSSAHFSARFNPILNYNSPLLNLLNVKYLISEKPLASSSLRLIYPHANSYLAEALLPIGVGVYQKNLFVYENTAVMPRAFVAHKYRYIPDAKEALKYISNPKFKPDEEVIVEELPAEAGSEIKVNTIDNDKVAITRYEPSRVMIDAELKSGGFLVLSDSYYPGWKAFVDGREQKIYQADYLLRGVYLPGGVHKVVFTYDPLSFKIGAAISVSAFIFAILYLFFLRIKT
ncbi:MAG: YfhO family protein [Candidatus Omnitrophica bacterium]|nr:YfhO family protein [Candidatus Omnitrophota bacterium]